MKLLHLLFTIFLLTMLETATAANDNEQPNFIIGDNSENFHLQLSGSDPDKQLKASAYRNLRQTQFSLDNPTNKAQKIWVHIENSRINDVQMVRNDGKQWQAGTDYPLSQWGQIGGNILLPDEIPPQTLYSYILFAETDGPINTSVKIKTDAHLLADIEYQQKLTGILTGFIAGLTIYGLFLGISHRDKSYFYLAGATSFFALLQLNDLGMLYPLWPDHPGWNQSFSTLCAIISSLTGCCLVRRHLLTEEYSPRIDKAFIIYGWYGLLFCIPIAFLNNNLLNTIVFAVPASAFMLVQIYLCIIRTKEGYAPARMFLIASLTPFIAGAFIILTFVGLIPGTPATRVLPLLATCIQLIIFSFALAERINWLNQQKLLAANHTVQLRSESQAKQSFLAQVSHELRTPLLGIIGLADLEKKHMQTPENHALLEGIHTSSTQLLGITNNLLTYARLDAGKWSVEDRIFSPEKILTDTLKHFQQEAERKHLSLGYNGSINLPDTVIGDPDILQRILKFIIENALKFTHQGSVSVSANICAQTEECLSIRFEILDTGIGFDRIFEERAFKLFELADKSSTRSYQGSGLGLPLSKKFCELLGGDIGCDSQNGHGTTFWFTIPFKQVGTNAHSSDSSAPHVTLADPDIAQRVLAAEDDETLQIVIKAQLNKASVISRIFSDGKQLLDAYIAEKEKSDCILLDWNMPVMNAPQTIEAIRRYEQEARLSPTKIVIMSAYDRQAGIASQIPADIVLIQKPLDMASLQKALIIDKHTSHIQK